MGGAQLASGNSVNLLWNPKYRYPRRQAQLVADLVAEFSSPHVGEALGDRAEHLVLEGFAAVGFTMTGRETNEHRGVAWEDSNHDIDFIFDATARRMESR